MRPTRRYYIEFAHGEHTVKLYTLGTTPCKGRAHGYELLEAYLKASPELPSNGWRLARQDDLGVVGC